MVEAGEMKLTKAQSCLIALIAAGLDARHMTSQDAREGNLEREFRTARAAGYLTSAGYECSVKGDDFLDSEAGREALASIERKRPMADRLTQSTSQGK